MTPSRWRLTTPSMEGEKVHAPETPSQQTSGETWDRKLGTLCTPHFWILQAERPLPFAFLDVDHYYFLDPPQRLFRKAG